MSYLARFQDFWPPRFDAYYPINFESQRIGWLHKDHLNLLASAPEIFTFNCAKQTVIFSQSFVTLSFDERSLALAQFAAYLRQQNLIHNWRDELYGIYLDEAFQKPIFTIERGVVPLFAFKAYGVHVNAYTYIDGLCHMWIAQRAAHRVIEPLKYDQIAAGGLPYEIGVRANVLKECAEEASIPENLAQYAVACGSIDYIIQDPHGVRNDHLFCFDLELPQQFTPKINDGEVAAFFLYPMAEIIRLITQTQTFKPNSALVAIHFLIRHGFITSDHPEYAAIKKALSL